MNNQLYCGAARALITPPEELLGDLNGLMNTEFGGVVDDLYVRAIALMSNGKKMLLLSFDLDKAPWPAEYMEELAQQTGIDKDAILYISIHTHSAPVTGDRPYEGPNYIARKPVRVQEATKKYEQFIKQQMFAAAREAIAAMVPARYGSASGESHINVNRVCMYEVCDEEGHYHTRLGTGTDYTREADHTLFVMKFEDMQGNPLAFFMNYPVHNTVMIKNGCGAGGKVGITSDLGGNVSKWMEEIYPGSIAIWSSGAAGDINPVMSNQVYREDPETGAPVEYYETDGNIPRAMLHTLTAHHFADVRRTVRAIEGMTDQAVLSADERIAEVPGKDENGQPVPYQVRVHKMKIGTVNLIGFSGELYSELGKTLREKIDTEHMVLLNHDASLLGNAGYIFSDEIFELCEKYPGDIVGMNHTWLQPGLIADELEQKIREMLEET